jgi:hypothetical protein
MTALFAGIISRVKIAKVTVRFEQFMQNSSFRSINAATFAKEVKDKPTNTYQIIDVREPHELDAARLSYVNVINLPLSRFSNWGPLILQGKDVNKTVTTYCLVRKRNLNT